MIKKQIYINITEKDEEYANKMLENDPDFASFPNLVSMAIKDYIKRYKESEKEKEW